MAEGFYFHPEDLLRQYYETIGMFQNYGQRFAKLGIRNNSPLAEAHTLIEAPQTRMLFNFLTYQGTATTEEYQDEINNNEGPQALALLVEILGLLEIARQELEDEEKKA